MPQLGLSVDVRVKPLDRRRGGAYQRRPHRAALFFGSIRPNVVQ
jgi:hypothetical protein